MIFVTFSFVAGVMLLQQMDRLPEYVWSIPAVLVAALSLRRRKFRACGWFALGWAWALVAANLAMQERLNPEFEGKDLLIDGHVIGIPQTFGHDVRFGFKIDGIDGFTDDFIPRKVRLSWYSVPVALKTGDRWRLQVRMKQPHGNLNPGGFDYEEWLYLHGYRATGYVRPSLANRRVDSGSRVSIDRMRQSIATRLYENFQASPVSGIIQALVIGEQHDISIEQWEVFRRTGTSHLVAISGLQVGLVAGFVLWMTRWVWLRIGTLRIPAPAFGACCAALCAIIYAALAGFSLPTQRALIMVGLVMGGILLRRKLNPGHTLAAALFLIVLSEPTSVLSPGLWLSFSAVALIAYILAGRISQCGDWVAAHKIHLVTAIGLAPLLLLYFQQFSLIAPCANLIAVPVINLLVVPAGLLGSVVLLIYPPAGIAILQLGVFALEILWHVLEWLANFPFAQWTGVQPSFGIFCSAIAGLLLMFSPRGIPARWLAVPLLLPIIFTPVNPPDTGEFRFTLLDVGQGLAAVVETANHTLVFDTGARFSERLDMGSAVVAPFLKSRDIHAIDRLVISHADNDHLGGARSLAELFRIDRVDISTKQSIDWRDIHECKAGQNWNWDGVEFRMLAPLHRFSARENDHSCVLKIDSGSHSILLTGDIEKATEADLVKQYGPQLASDYLVVAHHGSNTSSTSGFLEAVRPKFALVPAGYRNRYGFPRPEVVERLERVGSRIYNTADSGAILVSPDPEQPTPIPRRYRSEVGRYYNFQAPDSG
jgi:competence protein ComEC